MHIQLSDLSMLFLHQVCFATDSKGQGHTSEHVLRSCSWCRFPCVYNFCSAIGKPDQHEVATAQPRRSRAHDALT